MEKTSTLIALHGFMGSPSDWDFLKEYLPEGMELAALPLPTQSWEECLEDLKKTIQRLPTPRLLLGYSMGGRLAMGLLAKDSSLFKAAVIEAADPGLEEQSLRDKRLAWDKSLIDKLQELSREEFLDQWYSMELFGAIQQHPHYSRLREKRKKIPMEQIRNQLENLSVAGQPDYHPFLHTLCLPMLFVAGERDLKYQKIGKDLSFSNSNIMIETLPDCGHMAHFERPSKFARIALGFLQRKAF